MRIRIPVRLNTSAFPSATPRKAKRKVAHRSGPSHRAVRNVCEFRITQRRYNSGDTWKKPDWAEDTAYKTSPKAGKIQQKRSDTLNKNLDKPVPQFRADAKLGTTRKATGKVGEAAVARAAKRIKPGK